MAEVKRKYRATGELKEEWFEMNGTIKCQS